MVRLGKIEDLDTLVEYNLMLAEETEGLKLDREKVLMGVKRCLLDHNKGVYYVYEEDGKVVGQLMHTKEWSDWRNGEFWWIMSVYVHKDYRKKGVFKALYENLKTIAKEDYEVCGLRLYVEFDNEKAQGTYKKLGMNRCHYYIFEDEF